MTLARRFLSAAALASVLSGCAVSKELVSSQLWPWQQEDDSAQGLTADLTRPFPSTAKLAHAQRPSEFDFNHPLIEEQISRFEDDLHGFYERALERSGRYVPVMQAILERHNVPKELAYLPLIESGYETCAVSPAGAVGPWQFIYATGVRYGLRIDRMVDERRDPIKSTEAAAKYLHDLYDMFNDWHLALAAYNSGEGNIGRILESRRIEDYWSMIGKGCLYPETENYVPKFLAALQIAENPSAYGFEAPASDPLVYDWVRVNRPQSLAKVAEMSGTSLEELKQLNPALKQGAVPPSGYIVKIPKGTKRSYQAKIDEVDPESVAWSPRRTACDPDDGVHCVKRGDTYASIAAVYNVSARDLLQVNGRKASHPLRIGEALVIPGRQPRDDDAPAATVADGRAKSGSQASTGRSTGRSNSPTTHTVRRGDTPATIAQRYGLTTNQLLKANGLRNARGLQVGQKLRVPGTASAKAAPAKPQAAPKSAAQAKPARATAQAKAAAPAKAGSAAKTHVIAKGDTPASIAKRHNISVPALLKANGIRDVRGLKPGQKLTVPRQRASSGRANVGG